MRDGNENMERGGWTAQICVLEEMSVPLTELTPQACHILFSASLSTTRLRTEKGCKCSHMLLANSPSLMIRKAGLG